MISGQSVYSDIGSFKTSANREYILLNGQVTDYENEILSHRRTITSAFSKLARIFLTEDVDFDLLSQPERIQASHAEERERQDELERLLENYQNQADQYSAKLETATQTYIQAEQDLDKAVADLEAELEADPTFQSLREQQVAAGKKLGVMQRHAEVYKEEAKKLVAEYEANQAFMYLLNRGYGTNEYEGGMFSGTDDQLAFDTRYSLALERYTYLTTIDAKFTQAMQATVRAKEEADLAAKEHAGQVGMKYALGTKRKTVSQTEQHKSDFASQLANTNASIRQTQNQLDNLHSHYTKQRLEIEAKGLAQLDIRTLWNKAQSTTRGDDDTLVSRIQASQEAITQKSRLLKETTQARDNAQAYKTRVEQLQSKFQARGWDGYRSEFSDTLNLSVFMADLQNGSSADNIMQRLAPYQSTRQPPRRTYRSNYGQVNVPSVVVVPTHTTHYHHDDSLFHSYDPDPTPSFGFSSFEDDDDDRSSFSWGSDDDDGTMSVFDDSDDDGGDMDSWDL